MGYSPSTADLPAVLAKVVQLWIDVVEAAAVGMGQDVMRVAAEAVIGLQERVVMTPDLERVIADARLASDDLGISLDREGFDPSQSRADALAALNVLITLLRDTRPNERAMGLGRGWWVSDRNASPSSPLPAQLRRKLT